MIICFIFMTNQLILCGLCKENLHTDQLAGAERAKINGRQYDKELFREKTKKTSSSESSVVFFFVLTASFQSSDFGENTLESP